MTNQRTTFRLLGFTLALAFLAAAGPSAEAGPVNVGRVTAYHGNVRVTRAATNATFQVTGEQPVLFRDVNETDFDSQVELRFKDGSTLVIGEDTVLTIDEMVFDPKTGRRSAVLNLRAGSLRLKATKNHLPGSKFEVKTPILVAGLRGTELTVTVDKKTGQARVITLEGAVAVWKRGEPKGARKEVLVVAGMTTEMTPGAAGPRDAARATREMIRSATQATRIERNELKQTTREARQLQREERKSAQAEKKVEKLASIADRKAAQALKVAAKKKTLALRKAEKAGKITALAANRLAHEAARSAAGSAAKEAAKSAAKRAAKIVVAGYARNACQEVASQVAKSAAHSAVREAVRSAAGQAVRIATQQAAKSAASDAAAQVAKEAAKNAANDAAKEAANNAAKEAADNAAKNAAKQAADNAASQAASNAVADAAKNNGKGKGKKS